MQKIALSHRQHALFLDFDGTLADTAPRPDAVQLHGDTAGMLQSIYQMFGGAVAVVSGRSVADIDEFLSPLVLPVAGEHGAQWRSPQGEFFELDDAAFASHLEPVLHAAELLVKQHSALLLERKTVGFALHYRMAPALYALCWNTIEPMIRHSSMLTLMRGKYVMEVVPSAVDKGTAISSFMQLAPFRGRMPIFFGDDVTDEAGFAAVQGAGGHGVKVGAGPSVALHRCPNPAALRAWLGQAVNTSQARLDELAPSRAHAA